MNPATVLIVGCGDIGLRLARRLLAAGQRVHGVVRSAESAAKLQARGLTPLVLNLDVQAPPPAAEVYWLAPPPASGVTDPRLRRWLEANSGGLRKLVYLSTSGVYGHCGGRWIDESEPPNPVTDRGRRRLDAERALAETAALRPLDYTVLRVPGIYGPGRLPVERLRRGLPVIRDDASDPASRRWTNRIHAEDLAEALVAARKRGRPGAVYHASDGHPGTMSDYFRRCAVLLGLPAPPEIDAGAAREVLSPALMSFLDESRRLRNDRLREELGVILRYPDLASGLPGCVEDGAASP